MPEDAPTQAREEVAEAARGRMAQLGLSPAQLRGRSGLSVNTIKDIANGTGDHNRSTWVAMSAGLEWPWDYLVNILHGAADQNVKVKSPLETHLAKLADGMAQIEALRQEVAGLKDVIHEFDAKLDAVARERRSAGQDAAVFQDQDRIGDVDEVGIVGGDQGGDAF